MPAPLTPVGRHPGATLAPARRVPQASPPGLAAGKLDWVRDRKFALLQFFLIAVSFLFSVSPGGLDYVGYAISEADPNAEEPTDPWFRVQWSSMFALALVIIWRRRHLALRLLPGLNPMLMIFLAWCTLSSLWAVWSPMKTFTQSISMFFVFGVAFASILSAWQPTTLARSLRTVLTLILVASCLLAVFVPMIGVESGVQFQLQDSWRGLTMTKNILGQVGAVAVILWVHAWATRDSRPWITLLGLAISVFVMLKSRSSTSLFLSVLSSAILAAILRSPVRLEGKRAIVWLSVALLVMAPIFTYLVLVGSLAYEDIATPIGESVGKDNTFSGRTFIWAPLWDTIQTHPWLGLGFMGFWNGPDSLAADILATLRWPAPNGHEGYLDIWNELGFIGLLLFFGFIVLHFRQIFQLNARNRNYFALHFVLVPYLLLENLTETGWFRPVSVTYLMTVYSSVTLTRLLFEQRLQAGRLRPIESSAAQAEEPAASVPWGPWRS